MQTAVAFSLLTGSLLGAVVLGILVPVIAVICYFSAGAGLALIAGTYAVEAIMINDPGGFELGINLYYPDLTLGLLAAVAVVRWILARDRPPVPRAWMVFCVGFLISLGWGLGTFGSSAGVQARGYFYSVAVTSYVVAFPAGSRAIRSVLSAITWLAVVIAVLCIYRWMVYYLPIPDLLPPQGVYNIDGAIRVVRSNDALILAEVMVIGLVFASVSRAATFARFAAPVLLAFVLVLQHRSVWLSAIMGVVCATMLLGRSGGKSKVARTVLTGAMCLAVVLPAMLSDKFSGLTGDISDAAGRALRADGSVGERFENWNGMLELYRQGNLLEQVVGRRFGTDATRFVSDKQTGGYHKITYYAHNYFVQTLFNLGLMGLVASLFVFWNVAIGLYRRFTHGEGDPMAGMLLTLLVMQITYYVPYGTDYFQAAVLGLSLAYVAGAPQSASQRKHVRADAQLRGRIA